MKHILGKILAGDHPVQEYSPVTIEDEIREHVYLSTGALITNISPSHWLLCLEPVIFGVWAGEKEAIALLNGKGGYRMYFTSCAADSSNIQKNAVAILDLDFLELIEEEGGCLLLFKLTHTSLGHVHSIKSLLYFLRYYKKPGLTFSKFKSLVAAFCYPRQVRLVSFREGDYYTIFPMDLVGEIGWGNRFVFGLRHTNAALSRIIETKNLVVAEVSCKQKDLIYGLGKHHSSAPPPLKLLPFRVFQSTGLGFYLPEWIESYREIRILKTINLGSQMLLWGEWTNNNIVSASSGHLYHIHFLHWLDQQKRGMGYSSV